MTKSVVVANLLLLTFAASNTYAESAETLPGSSIARQVLAQAALQENPGYSLTAVTVELEPGTTIDAHTHSGFVFAYVLEGTIRSKLNAGEAIDYQAGESWVEPSGTLHALTQNPSRTEAAKFLAVFVAETDSRLTTMTMTSDSLE